MHFICAIIGQDDDVTLEGERSSLHCELLIFST